MTYRSILAVAGLAGCLVCAMGCGGGVSDGGSPDGPTRAEPSPADPGAGSDPPPAEPDPAWSPAADSMGFVFSGFGYVSPDHAHDPCPGGFTLGPNERLVAGLPALSDDCDDPAAHSDPNFVTLDGGGRVDGFDLDGLVSTRNAPGDRECAHDDFSGSAGEEGVDLQMWRSIGCIRGFQPGEIADIVVDEAVRNGSMTILLEVRGVEDERNDDSVEVQILASQESPAIGGDGSVLPYGTLRVHADPFYHGSVAEGRIVDGVLTAGPMRVSVRLNIQIVEGDLTFEDAYVRLETDATGVTRGTLFGYQAVDQTYEIFGRQAGTAGAAALSYSCTGLYAALQENADGGYDPSTGRCSSLSVGHWFTAVRAFVAR